MRHGAGLASRRKLAREGDARTYGDESIVNLIPSRYDTCRDKESPEEESETTKRKRRRFRKGKPKKIGQTANKGQNY